MLCAYIRLGGYPARWTFDVRAGRQLLGFVGRNYNLVADPYEACIIDLRNVNF